MSKRVKPALPVTVLNSLEDADSTMAKIGALRRNIDLIETGMNDDIAAIKLRAAEQAEPYRQEIAMLEESLGRYAVYHKSNLFISRKSLDLTFGSFGFRQSSKLKVLPKYTLERVLQELRDRGLNEHIRVKEEINKESLKGLPPERLKELGCKLEQKDDFFYELAETELGSPAFAVDSGPDEAA
ncbi:host-nuclease inhibitor Gam family protein [Desulfovibrio sp. OttesenSCG-928-C14]|nr:host-nuclease inhibitor Gam family protein [Desulfovibrio sp. OttesenSCG-928-C14]